MKSIIEKIFDLNRFFKVSIQLVVDGFLILLSFMLAWYLRLDRINFILDNDFWIYNVILIPSTLFFLYNLNFYKNIIRFISFSFVKTAFLSAIISSILVFIISYSFNLFLPRSIPLIYFLIFSILICGIRFQLSFIYQYYMQEKKEHIGIIDDEKNGIKIINFFNQDSKYIVKAIFNNKKNLIGTTIGGVPIYTLNHLEKIILTKKINILLLPSSILAENFNSSLLDLTQKYKIEIKKYPDFENSSNYHIPNSLNDISIEDILGRNSIKPDEKLLDKNIKNKTVLVTGAGGSIGSKLCFNILKRKPKALILLEVSEYNLYKIDKELNELKDKNSNIFIFSILGSIQDSHKLDLIFKSFKINTIYHAAAYKHVPLIEMNVIEGIKNNVYGTKLLIDKSIKNNVNNFILISSDKAVRPTNFMGASKRVAEILCLLKNENQKNTIFCVVRFGNVLGSSGSVIPLFKSQLAKGGPLTVTDKKIERYFMTIQEASELVIQAGSLTKKSGEIFILDMGRRIKVLDLAKQMIKLNGFVPNINHSNNFEKKSNEILIHFTGLRPGEKLIEELIYKTKIYKTKHPRIMKTKDKLNEKINYNKYIVRLISKCETNNLQEIRTILYKIDKNFNLKSYDNDILTN